MHFSVDFSVHLDRVGTVGVVRVRGELDAETVDVLTAGVQTLLLETGSVVLDLGETTLLDCRALSALLALERQARRRGARLRCGGARRIVRLVFTTFDVVDLLGGTATVEEEIRTVGASPQLQGSAAAACR